ncbi:hypothetical protein N9D31_03030 [Oligoflexaceae bacterium]|nr:hypothetical protein [Oligoflexaceae bacterium]
MMIVFLVFGSTSCLKRSETSQKSIFQKKKQTVKAQVNPDPNDPFRPSGEAALLQKGTYEGKAIDIDWRRSNKILSGREALKYFKDFDATKEYAIANVKEADKFYVARFAKDAIEQVILNRERLFVKIGVHHTSMRFKLKNEEFFELKSQRLDEPQESKKYQSLSFGVFAVGAPGIYFDPKNSIKGDLVSSYLFFTPPDQSARGFDIPIKYKMYEIVLDKLTNPQENFKLFQHIATEGDRLGYQEIYGMFRNNCVHRLLQLLRDGLPKKYSSDGIIDKILLGVMSLDVLPTGLANGFAGVMRRELERAGTLSESTPWKSFWEVPDLVDYLYSFSCAKLKKEKLSIADACHNLYYTEPHEIPSSILARRTEKVTACKQFNASRCSDEK